jgi:hypothetical protein
MPVTLLVPGNVPGSSEGNFLVLNYFPRICQDLPSVATDGA